MPIRDAVSADFDAVRAIARAAYQPFVAAIGRDPAPMVADFGNQIAQGAVRVLERDDICGYAVSYRGGSVWHVENLAVAPQAHGTGAGRALLADVEARAAGAGAQAVELYTNIAMTGALAFYPKLGYRETGRREEDGFHRVYFRKELA